MADSNSGTRSKGLHPRCEECMIKEKIGRATNDPDLESEGTAEKIGGKVQKKVGDVEKVLGKEARLPLLIDQSCGLLPGTDERGGAGFAY